MSQKLTILFVPIDGVGHINACTGIGQELLRRGHSVVMATLPYWKGKLEPLGFTEKFYPLPKSDEESVAYQNEIIRNMSSAMALSPIEKFEQLYPQLYSGLVAQLKAGDSKLREIVAEVKPDIIIADGIYVPALMVQKDIPWMSIISLSPVGLTVGDVPPAYSGFPTQPQDNALWNEFIEKSKVYMGPSFEDFKSWVLEKGGPEIILTGSPFWHQYSPYGNLYMYPKELSYESIRTDPPNFHRIDTFTRFEPEAFEIPAKLVNLPGKIVYVSMGTIGCSCLDLMKKLITFCSMSQNRFIVSKGPFGDQLELGENMWGENYVPQTNVLPLVDLVITHGGNNTISESFYFGKRVLVLPLFCDQLDNGQRVAETGLGLTLDPCYMTSEEFLGGIDALLSDDLLEKRMMSIGIRMRAANSLSKAASLIEEVATKGAVN